MPSKCVITTRSRSKPCLKLDYKSIAIEYLNKVINKVVISAPSIAIENCIVTAVCVCVCVCVCGRQVLRSRSTHKMTCVNKMRTLINNPILSDTHLEHVFFVLAMRDFGDVPATFSR